MIPVTENILLDLDNILFDFLLNSKPATIKRNTVIAPVEYGGLGMIDIYAVHDTAKCTWIRRLFDNTDAKWKSIFLYMINIGKDLLNKNLEIRTINNFKTEFY